MQTGQVILNQTIGQVPTNGTNEVQTLTIGGTPSAGASSSISLTWNGLTSIAVLWSATNATFLANVQAALDGLFSAGGTSGSNCLVADATLSSGIGTATITFKGSYAATPQNLLVAVNNLTGTSPTAVVTRTTSGVTASDRSAAPGELLLFTGNTSNSCIQTLTIGGTPTGTFTISGTTAQNTAQTLTTAAITWSATNGTLLTNINNALNTTFGTSNVVAALGTITSGVGTITLTMSGTNAFSAVPVFTATGLTTGTTTIAITTTGGTISASTAPPIGYLNYSEIAWSPNWVPTGAPVKLALGSPALGSTIAVHAGVADTGSDQTISTAITNPDVPRALVFTPSGTTGNVTAVSMVVTGTDVNANVIVETLPAFTAGAATAVTSVNAFKTVTSYVQPACGASVTITPTCSPKLGIGIPISIDTVESGYLAGVREATRPTGTAGANSIAKNLVQLSSALNASAVIVYARPS